MPHVAGENAVTVVGGIAEIRAKTAPSTEPLSTEPLWSPVVATGRGRPCPRRPTVRWRACAPDRSNSRLAEQQLEVLELAQERLVLVLELLVGLSGRLEHREGEGAAAFGQRHDPRREELERLLARAGEHVDHARPAVGVDLEEELAESVHDLVAPVDEPYGLMVLQIEGDRIAGILGIPDPWLFERCGLPLS